jgi:hypothetical protein
MSNQTLNRKWVIKGKEFEKDELIVIYAQRKMYAL